MSLTAGAGTRCMSLLPDSPTLGNQGTAKRSVPEKCWSRVRKKMSARRQENRREVSQESILLSHAWSGSLLLSMALTFVRRRFHGKESSPLEAIRELG